MYTVIKLVYGQEIPLCCVVYSSEVLHSNIIIIRRVVQQFVGMNGVTRHSWII